MNGSAAAYVPGGDSVVSPSTGDVDVRGASEPRLHVHGAAENTTSHAAELVFAYPIRGRAANVGDTGLLLIQTVAPGELGSGRAVSFQGFARIRELGLTEPIFAALDRLRATWPFEAVAEARVVRFEDSADELAFLQITLARVPNTETLLDIEDALTDWVVDSFPRREEKLIVYLKRS